MKIIIVLVVILTSSSIAWAGESVEYCTNFLKAEEVNRICGSKKLHPKNSPIKGVSICDLRFSTTGPDPLRAPQLQLLETQKFSKFSGARGMLNASKMFQSAAVDVSGIGDGAWLHAKKKDDYLGVNALMGFHSGRHYFELSSYYGFCEADKLRDLANIVISRLPK